MTWQPIATAPKDGTVVFIFDKPLCVQSWWVDDTRYVAGGYWGDGLAHVFHPTHWMPLPPAPVEGEG